MRRRGAPWRRAGEGGGLRRGAPSPTPATGHGRRACPNPIQMNIQIGVGLAANPHCGRRESCSIWGQPRPRLRRGSSTAAADRGQGEGEGWGGGCGWDERSAALVFGLGYLGCCPCLPTVPIVVARGATPTLLLSTSSSVVFIPALLLWLVSGCTVRIT